MFCSCNLIFSVRFLALIKWMLNRVGLKLSCPDREVLIWETVKAPISKVIQTFSFTQYRSTYLTITITIWVNGHEKMHVQRNLCRRPLTSYRCLSRVFHKIISYIFLKRAIRIILLKNSFWCESYTYEIYKIRGILWTCKGDLVSFFIRIWFVPFVADHVCEW